MKNLTYKIHKKTGQYRSFILDFIDIKIGGKIVGSIAESSHGGDYTIGLIVEKADEEKAMIGSNCDWKWIYLQKRFPDSKEAKDFLKDNLDKIHAKFKLHPLED